MCLAVESIRKVILDKTGCQVPAMQGFMGEQGRQEG